MPPPKIKVAITGPKAAGKSTFIRTYAGESPIENLYNQDRFANYAEDHPVFLIEYKTTDRHEMCSDILESKRKIGVTGSNIVIFMIDLTKEYTEQEITTPLQDVQRALQGKPIILMGNMLSKNRTMSDEAFAQYAIKINAVKSFIGNSNDSASVNEVMQYALSTGVFNELCQFS